MNNSLNNKRSNSNFGFRSLKDDPEYIQLVEFKTRCYVENQSYRYSLVSTVVGTLLGIWKKTYTPLVIGIFGGTFMDFYTTSRACHGISERLEKYEKEWEHGSLVDKNTELKIKKPWLLYELTEEQDQNRLH